MFSATIFSQRSQLWLSSTNPPISSLSAQNHPILSSQVRSRRRPITWPRYRRRHPNAGTFRTQNSSNLSSGENNDDDDDDDDDDFGRKRKRRRRRWWSDNSWPEMDQGSGILEEFIDSVWIFKVFESFGLMLPAIILSMLLVTGPKAFLMALALPIGQSALALAFKKLWGGTQDNPKRKTKTKKKPRVSTASNVELEEEEEEEESQGTRKRTVGYQSWVARDDVSVNKDSQDAFTFGGWDELDRPKEFDMGPLRRSARTGRSGRTRMDKGKFSRRERKSGMPLLLRLLIAVFPFLGSWTKML